MNYISKLLDPKNDYVFKRIFGYIGNENITKGLLEAILDIHITSLQLDCKEILEKDLNSDKLGILDIRAIINDNIQCDIEMQIVDRKNIVNRILAYWSKLYNQSIQEGKDYNTAQKAIILTSIFFLFIMSLLQIINCFIKYYTIFGRFFKIIFIFIIFAPFILILYTFNSFVIKYFCFITILKINLFLYYILK